MQTQTDRIVLAAANAAAVCASQTPGAAGALTLTASPVTLDAPRRILVTCAANESGKTLTITGTLRGGYVVSEAVSLPNASTVATQQDFASVTAVTISAAAAGAIQVGTNGTASGRWILLNRDSTTFNTSIAVNLGGVSATVSVEGTLDPVDPAIVVARGDTWSPPAVTTLVGFSALTADTWGALSFPMRAVRLTVTSGAAIPGARITVLQTGIA